MKCAVTRMLGPASNLPLPYPAQDALQLAARASRSEKREPKMLRSWNQLDHQFGQVRVICEGAG